MNLPTIDLKGIIGAVRAVDEVRKKITDKALNTPVVPFLPDSTPKNIAQTVSDTYIYDPESKRVLPQSPYYPENREIMDESGNLNPKALDIFMGMAAPLKTTSLTRAETLANKVKPPPGSFPEGWRGQPIDDVFDLKKIEPDLIGVVKPSKVKTVYTPTGISGTKRYEIMNDGEYIGEVVYTLSKSGDKSHVYIDNIQIDDEFQKKGIGTTIISDILKRHKATLTSSSNLTDSGQKLQNKFLSEKLSIDGRKNNTEANKSYTSIVYRGRISGDADANIGKFYTTDKDIAKNYANFKQNKIKGSVGEVIQEKITLNNPLKLSQEDHYSIFLENSDKVPELGIIANKMLKDESGELTDELIVRGEKMLMEYAKKHGYDGVIFGNGELGVIDLR